MRSQTKEKGGREAVLTAYKFNERRRVQRQAAIVTREVREEARNERQLDRVAFAVYRDEQRAGCHLVLCHCPLSFFFRSVHCSL